MRSLSVEMSAMAGLAMESSAKGTSLSTTTARFIGTVRARDGAPPNTWRFCAQTPGTSPGAGAAASSAAIPAAAKVRLIMLLRL